MSSSKQINSYLRNLVQKFDVSCEHIRYLLVSGNYPEFRANLITGKIIPKELSIERNQNLISQIQEFYIRHIVPIIGTEVKRAEIVLITSRSLSRTLAEIEIRSGKVWRVYVETSEPLIVA